MKQRVFTVQFWVIGTGPGPTPLVFLDPTIWSESHVATSAEAFENLIFFETVIDLGLTYDGDTGVFERTGEVTEGV